MVSIDGNDYWPGPAFFLLYCCQVCHAAFSGFGLAAYDGVFLQITMSLTYRFTTMRELLNLLDYQGKRDNGKDRQILVDIYKMHYSVLE